MPDQEGASESSHAPTSGDDLNLPHAGASAVPPAAEDSGPERKLRKTEQMAAPKFDEDEQPKSEDSSDPRGRATEPMRPASRPANAEDSLPAPGFQDKKTQAMAGLSKEEALRLASETCRQAAPAARGAAAAPSPAAAEFVVDYAGLVRVQDHTGGMSVSCVNKTERVYLKVVNTELKEHTKRLLTEASIYRKLLAMAAPGSPAPSCFPVFLGAKEATYTPEAAQAKLGLPKSIAYIALRLMEGSSLDSAAGMDSLKKCTLAHKIELLIGIAESVLMLHKAGYLHRDLKPGNIFLGPDGKPVLLDFGLAAKIEEAQPRESPIFSRKTRFRVEAAREGATELVKVPSLGDPTGAPETARETKAGQLLGTACYADPEAFADSETAGATSISYTVQSDVFAFGGIAFFVLTGKHPYPVVNEQNGKFAATDAPQTELVSYLAQFSREPRETTLYAQCQFEHHAESLRQSLSGGQAALLKEIVSLVASMLEVRAICRPPSFETVIELLASISSKLAPEARSPTTGGFEFDATDVIKGDTQKFKLDLDPANHRPIKLGEGSFGVVFALTDAKKAVKAFYSRPEAGETFNSEKESTSKIGAGVAQARWGQDQATLVLQSASWVATTHATEQFPAQAFASTGLALSTYALVVNRYDQTLKDLLERRERVEPGSRAFNTPFFRATGYEVLRERTQLKDRFQVIANVLTSVASALQLFHTAGYCHRDVKPANIFTRIERNDINTPTYLVALGDYGFLSPLEASGAPSELRDQTVPTYNLREFAPGSIHYRSAEQRDSTDSALATIHAGPTSFLVEISDPKFDPSFVRVGDLVTLSRDSDAKLFPVTHIETSLGAGRSTTTCTMTCRGEAEFTGVERAVQIVIHRRVGLATDLFGFGAVAWDLLTAGKSAERLYDSLRSYDSPETRIDNVATDLLRERRSSLETLQFNIFAHLPSSSAAAAAFSAEVDAEIVKMLLKCILSRAEGSYCQSALAQRRATAAIDLLFKDLDGIKRSLNGSSRSAGGSTANDISALFDRRPATTASGTAPSTLQTPLYQWCVEKLHEYKADQNLQACVLSFVLINVAEQVQQLFPNDSPHYGVADIRLDECLVTRKGGAHEIVLGKTMIYKGAAPQQFDRKSGYMAQELSLENECADLLKDAVNGRMLERLLPANSASRGVESEDCHQIEVRIKSHAAIDKKTHSIGFVMHRPHLAALRVSVGDWVVVTDATKARSLFRVTEVASAQSSSAQSFKCSHIQNNRPGSGVARMDRESKCVIYKRFDRLKYVLRLLGLLTMQIFCNTDSDSGWPDLAPLARLESLWVYHAGRKSAPTKGKSARSSPKKRKRATLRVDAVADLALDLFFAERPNSWLHQAVSLDDGLYRAESILERLKSHLRSLLLTPLTVEPLELREDHVLSFNEADLRASLASKEKGKPVLDSEWCRRFWAAVYEGVRKESTTLAVEDDLFLRFGNWARESIG